MGNLNDSGNNKEGMQDEVGSEEEDSEDLLEGGSLRAGVDSLVGHILFCLNV